MWKRRFSETGKTTDIQYKDKIQLIAKGAYKLLKEPDSLFLERLISLGEMTSEWNLIFLWRVYINIRFLLAQNSTEHLLK